MSFLLEPSYVQKVIDEVMADDHEDGISVATATQEISVGLTWHPPIENKSHLPMFAEEGDAYRITSTGEAFVYSDGKWAKIMGIGEENRLDKVIRIMEEADGDV